MKKLSIFLTSTLWWPREVEKNSPGRKRCKTELSHFLFYSLSLSHSFSILSSTKRSNSHSLSHSHSPRYVLTLSLFYIFSFTHSHFTEHFSLWFFNFFFPQKKWEFIKHLKYPTFFWNSTFWSDFKTWIFKITDLWYYFPKEGAILKGDILF